MSTNGKGSKPRPYSVSYEKYADTFDDIFRKKKNVEAVKPVPKSKALENLEKATVKFIEANPEFCDWIVGNPPKIEENPNTPVIPMDYKYTTSDDEKK